MKKDIKQEAAKGHDPVKEAAKEQEPVKETTPKQEAVKQEPKAPEPDPYDTRTVCPATPRCVVLGDPLAIYREGRA